MEAAVQMEESAEVVLETSQHLPAKIEIEKSKAVQEVQASLIIAKKFPRDQNASYQKIMESCKRLTLASQAIYSLPISGSAKTGPSIRLAEVLAISWGNISFGVKEVSRENGRSHCLAYCWDQEANTRSESEFTVEHWIEVGKGGNKTRKSISDPVEIDRLIANRGSRKLRNCILHVIPPDIVEAALKACKATMAKGDGKPLADRIRECVALFAEVGVTIGMIEDRLKHPMDQTNGEEIADLAAIYKSIVDKQAKRTDFFNTGEKNTSEASQDIANKIKNMGVDNGTNQVQSPE